MSVGVIAMLLGLFVVPAYLLWIGHHWRKRSARTKRAFWGGVIGHSTAGVAATIAGMYEPSLWSELDLMRGVVGYWSMLAGGIGGIAIGALLGSRGTRK